MKRKGLTKMPRERVGYRENLQDILEFSNNRRLLTLEDVRLYTGFRDNRTLKRRFPFKDGFISAATLALCLTGGETK